MASTFSKLKIELIGTGDQSGTWGVTTNNNLGSSSTYRGLEQAIVGMATLVTGDFTANSYTLPYTDSNDDQDFRCLVLDITATLSGAGEVIVPAIQKPYIVMNNSVGGYAVTVKVTGQTGISVPNGAKVLLYNNGTDVGTAVTYLTSLTLGSALGVASGGTGLTSGTSGGIPYFSSTSAMTSSAALAANALVIGGGAGVAPSTTTTGTGVVTAVGNAVNTTGGLVTQNGTLAASALLVGGGASTAIASTTTGTGVVTAIGNNTNAANGLAVLGAGGALAVAQGGTGLSTTTAYGLIAAGTTATGNFQQVSGTGTSGQVLTSNGASALPTWQNTVSLSGNNAFTGANTFYNATGQTFAQASTNDGIIVQGRAGGSSSYRVTFTTATLSSSTTLTLPNVTDTVATIGTAQTFTAAQTFRAANAIRSEASSTQDAIIVAGRAGGTNSYAITLTPATLSASRTVTLPDGGGNYTVGYINLPAVGTKTTSYTLATADVGKYVQVGTSGSITIPDAAFAEGDVISIFNNTTGNITITCTITTAYIAGTNSDKATMTLATRGLATILFISSTVCVVSGNVS